MKVGSIFSKFVLLVLLTGMISSCGSRKYSHRTNFQGFKKDITHKQSPTSNRTDQTTFIAPQQNIIVNNSVEKSPLSDANMGAVDVKDFAVSYNGKAGLKEVHNLSFMDSKRTVTKSNSTVQDIQSNAKSHVIPGSRLASKIQNKVSKKTGSSSDAGSLLYLILVVILILLVLSLLSELIGGQLFGILITVLLIILLLKLLGMV
ncbi:MAG: hypothetical protein ACI8ZN_001419 [Bacteroidia bacterium]|jgi:hypothetical protein